IRPTGRALSNASRLRSRGSLSQACSASSMRETSRSRPSASSANAGMEIRCSPSSPPKMPTDHRIAIYPGSFDPITLGHEDVARRALRVADRLIIGVARHQSQKKKGMFSVEERLEMIREVFSGVEE